MYANGKHSVLSQLRTYPYKKNVFRKPTPTARNGSRTHLQHDDHKHDSTAVTTASFVSRFHLLVEHDGSNPVVVCADDSLHDVPCDSVLAGGLTWYSYQRGVLVSVGVSTASSSGESWALCVAVPGASVPNYTSAAATMQGTIGLCESSGRTDTLAICALTTTSESSVSSQILFLRTDYTTPRLHSTTTMPRFSQCHHLSWTMHTAWLPLPFTQ